MYLLNVVVHIILYYVDIKCLCAIYGGIIIYYLLVFQVLEVCILNSIFLSNFYYTCLE